MIINKFVSIKSVIDDVYRQTQSQEELPYNDLIYWAYEALSLMRQPLQFIKKVTGHIDNPDLDITDYRAELPCDFHRLERISVNGLPTRYTGNDFHHLMSGDCCGTASASTNPSDIFIDNFGNAFSPQAALLGSGGDTEVTFDINNNYLTLSVAEGTVCMAYLAFPTDEYGLPMIPDDISYKVAIRKYLVKMLRYIEWAKDPDSRGKKALFDHEEEEWCWYVGSATSNAKMPHLEQMEAIKNQIVRILPNLNESANFFKGLGSQQQKRIT